MNVLLIGSGGREHAMAWKIAQSPKLTNLYVAPGNAGTAILAENIAIDINDFDRIKQTVVAKNIDMVVVGPEVPLVAGIADYFAEDTYLKNVGIIAPNKQAAQLEGSKNFSKAFMLRHDIPTAKYKSVTIDTIDEGIEFLHKMNAPYVLKADGLAGGKGVLILDNLIEAEAELRAMLSGKFADAGNRVVIEEFLSGIECSVFVLTDGKTYKILPEAKDYKRIGEGDTGLNTGGMGAVSPVPFADEEFMRKVEKRIIKPTIEGLCSDGIDYRGFIFFGLIKVNDEPYVIEYNARMGDPETEVVMLRLKSDLVELFEGVLQGNLSEKEIQIDTRNATTVMLVSGGYPEKYRNGYPISGLDDRYANCILFHAGTKLEGRQIVTNGGRVITVSAYGKDKEESLNCAYNTAKKIKFENMYYRKDIGFDI